MINIKWSLLDVRVRRGADVGSYHHLLQATVKLKLRITGSCKQTVQERFNVHLLKSATQARRRTEEDETDTSDQIQEKWEIIKKGYYQQRDTGH